MSGALTPGLLTTESESLQGVTLNFSGTSGGQAPYTTQLWRRTAYSQPAFNPASSPGLVRWYKSDTGLLTDSAAGFDGLTTQVLDAGNALQMGGTSFTVGGWFQWSGGGAQSVAIQKGTVGQATVEYGLYLDTSGVITGVIGSGAVTTTVSTAAPVALGVWYFVLLWWDSVAHTWNLSVNAGTPASVAWTAGTYNGSGHFQFGSGTLPMNGSISGPFVFSRVLTGAEQAELYNGGLGLPFTHWPTALQTDPSYQDYFSFAEGTGSRRVDPAGSQGWWFDDTYLNVRLTAGAMGSFAPTGTAVGWGHAPCEPISQLTDQSGQGNHAIQPNAPLRPVYVPGVLNGLPAIRFQSAGIYNTVGTAMQMLGTRSGAGTLLILCRLRGVPPAGSFWSLATSKGAAGLFSEVLVEGSGRPGYAPITFLNDYANSQAGVGFDQPPDTHAAHALAMSYGGLPGLSSYLGGLDGEPQVLVISGNLARATSDLGSLGGRLDQFGNVTSSAELDVFEVLEYDEQADADTLALGASYLATRGGLATGAPAAPTLNAVGSSQAVSLTWATLAGVTSWSIERSLAGKNAFQPIATLPAGQLSYVDAGLVNGVTWDYRIRGSSPAFGWGSYSAVASAQPFQWPQAAASLVCAYESGAAYQDAARATRAANQADPVRGLQDLTGNGNHAWTLAANQGTLQLSEVNGQPSVVFNPATPTWFNLLGGQSLNDHTIFLVASWPTIDATVKPWLGDATKYAAAVASSAVQYLAGAQTTGAQTLPASTNPVLLESTRAGTAWTVSWNRKQLTAGTVTVPTTAIGATYLGKAGANLLNAHVQAVVIAPSNLASTNPTLYAQIREYLRLKYSTPGVSSTVIVADSTVGLGSHDTCSLVLNDDDSIVCAWGTSTSFGSIVYDLMHATSYDGGNTWGGYATDFNHNSDLWRSCLTAGAVRLASGTLLRGAIRGYDGRNVFTRRVSHLLSSNDGGTTWTAPIPMGLDYSGFQPNSSYLEVFGSPYEPIPGGTLYWTAYGQPTGSTTTNVYFLQSTDGGLTWSTKSTIFTGTSTHAYSEAAIINTGGSNWLALTRDDGSAGGNLAQASSTDGGATWSAPVVPFSDKSNENVSPRLKRLQSGSLLLAYGHRDLGVRLRRSFDNGATWNAPFDAFVPVATSDTAAYPGLLQRRDGLILCGYYCLFNSGAGGKTQIQLVGFPESALP